MAAISAEQSIEANKPDDIFFDGEMYESQFSFTFPGPDVPFWIDLAKKFGPSVLELACGTGRVTIPVFESGVAVDGVDFSESMLRLARKRAEAKSLKINFVQGDLRALPFRDQYDLMFLPTATIAHLLTRNDGEAFLEGVRRGLHKSGMFAMDMHNPMRTFLKSWPFDPAGTERTCTHMTTGESLRIHTTQEYSTDTQILQVKSTYTFEDGSTKAGNIVLRLYFPADLQNLLHYNGFDVFRIYGNYNEGNFNSESERYVILAKPRG
jgi:SAM-dependent methyltransferase